MCSFKTNRVSTVAYLDLKEFKEKLKVYSKDFETYHEIKDKINIYNMINSIYLKCPFGCKELDHLIYDCYAVNANFYKDKIIIQNVDSICERMKFDRKLIQFSALLNVKEIKKKAFKYVVDQIVEQIRLKEGQQKHEESLFCEEEEYGMQQQSIMLKDDGCGYTFENIKSEININFIPKAYLLDPLFCFPK